MLLRRPRRAPGFYFSRATTPESYDKWQIYFQGAPRRDAPSVSP